MQLAGLIPAALRDRGLARARDLARKGVVDSDALDLTAPAALRPFVVAAVAGAGRARRRRPAGARRHRDQPRGRRPRRRAGLPARPEPGRGLPVLGDAAARAAVAALGHGRPAAGRAAPPRPPRREPSPVQVVVAPVRVAAAAAAQGPRRPRAGGADHRRRRPTSRTVARRLTDMAYARVDLVTKRGEFAVRGGILDVFPPTDEHPSRVEFWGDEVEEIRTFAVADQRTIDQVDRLWAPPCRELLLTPTVRARAAELAARAPGAGRDPRQAGRGHPGRGHGVAGARRCCTAPTAWSCCSTACRPAPTCCSATRSGSAPGRTT